MEKKFQNIYLTEYILLIAQDLWKAHYQILTMIFLKEFIELNVNIDTVIKNVKFYYLNTSDVTVPLNLQTLKMIKWNTDVYVVTKNINSSLTKI